ncbi:MAG TPA: exopolysaccharide transport family protein, partial [Burkholderiales bacterium]|nr:exopolysaccharide transport family protein [Burkholderiales bacterium]
MLQRTIEYQPIPLAQEPPLSAHGGRPDGITLSEIARILRRRLGIIALCTAALVMLAVLVVLIVRPVYTATATILIDPRRPNVVNVDTSQPTAPNPTTDDAAIESQVLLTQSVAVLRRVVDQLKLTQDPDFMPQPSVIDPIRRLFSAPARVNSGQDVAAMSAVAILQKRLKVTRQRNSFLVDIDVSAHEPQRAAQIANAVANAYFLELIRSKSDATKTAAGWLNQQLDDLKSRVSSSDKAVEEYRAANNLTMNQGATVNNQQVSDLNSKLIEARAEAAEARAKFEQVAQIAQKKADPGSVTEALASDTIARLRSQYADLAKNDADLSSRYGAQHPLVTAVRAQLRDTQKLINDEVQRILQGRQHAYEVAAAREASLQHSLESLQTVSGVSGQAEVRLRELQREADANRTLYEAFLARYKEATARESFELPEARIVTSADIPLQPSFPKALLFIGLAIPLGAAMGSLLAIAIDRLDGRVKTLEQIEAISGLPAVTAMPLIGLRELSRITKRGRQALSSYRPQAAQMLPLPLQPPLMRYIIEEPNSLFAEAVRAVRLCVQRAARVRRMQIVMVTSAIDGEGKTTLAANLALSHAMMGIKTVLVEGDLRNPELTRSLCPNAKVGLFDVALGRASLQQAIQVDQTTGLSMLPAPMSNELEAMSEFL